jgi:hypothetical protein
MSASTEIIELVSPEIMKAMGNSPSRNGLTKTRLECWIKTQLLRRVPDDVKPSESREGAIVLSISVGWLK